MTGLPPSPGATPPPKKPWEFVDEVRRDADAMVADAARPRAPLRTRLPWLSLLLVVLVVLNVLEWRRPRVAPQAFTSAEEEASARFGIYLAQQAVIHYRDSAGRLPPSLAAAGLEGGDIAYHAADSIFTLEARVGPNVYAYRFGQDLTPFSGAYTTLRMATQP